MGGCCCSTNSQVQSHKHRVSFSNFSNVLKNDPNDRDQNNEMMNENPFDFPFGRRSSTSSEIVDNLSQGDVLEQTELEYLGSDNSPDRDSGGSRAGSFQGVSKSRSRRASSIRAGVDLAKELEGVAELTAAPSIHMPSDVSRRFSFQVLQVNDGTCTIEQRAHEVYRRQSTISVVSLRGENSHGSNYFEQTSTGGLQLQSSFNSNASSSNESARVIETKELVRSRDTSGNKLLNEYAVIALIGQGNFAKVKLAVNTVTQKPYAIKIINCGRLRKKSRGTIPDVLQEVRIMQGFKHPNLVRLHEVISDEDSDKIYLVLQYMEGVVARTPNPAAAKSPSAQSSPSTPADIPKLRRMFLDMAHGLEYLHRRNIIHMDIKPENILVDEVGTCKLADFGVCSVLDGGSRDARDEDVLTRVQGTPLFFAPEMISGEPFHGKATDVWALGVTYFILVFGYLPFQGTNLQEISDDIVNGDVHCNGKNIPLELSDILYRMLSKDPALRITVPQLIGHQFFTDKVPLPWSVRMWKEQRLVDSKDGEEFVGNFIRLTLRDTTDRSHKTRVQLKSLEKTLLTTPSVGSASTPTPSPGDSPMETPDSTPTTSSLQTPTPTDSVISEEEVRRCSTLTRTTVKSVVNANHGGYFASGVGKTNMMTYNEECAKVKGSASASGRHTAFPSKFRIKK